MTVLRDGRLVAHELDGRHRHRLDRAADGRAATRPRSSPGHAGETGRSCSRSPASRRPGRCGPLVDDVSLTVRAGEVVGIYGLMGAGRTELFECLMGTPQADGRRGQGAREARHGGSRQGPAARRPGAGPGGPAARRAGPDDVRQGQHRAARPSARLTRGGLLSAEPRAQRWPATRSRDLSIKIPGLTAPVTSLSGGNQQKVVLARALLTEPVVLLLDEPTRGVDVGAKCQIAAIMADLAASGYGVLFISSELAEVMSMADRVLVMARGRITAEFTARRRHRGGPRRRLGVRSRPGGGRRIDSHTRPAPEVSA